jgi:alkylhydroperoxidase family enzyme
MRREDLEADGFVWNVSRLWGRVPAQREHLVALMTEAVRLGTLSMRQRGVLITAMASELGDSYCSLAWGGKLANETDATLAAGALRGQIDLLDPAERVLAAWARALVSDPNSTTLEDVEGLRAAGFSDDQIFGITLFVALRVAFSTVNDALGGRPDQRLVDRLPANIRESVTWGREPV